MKRALVIAYLYPPIFNSGTRRTLEFVNHLPDCGWSPTVLTVANPEPRECDPSLMDEVRPGTRIERAPLAIDRLAEGAAALLGRWLGAERVSESIRWRLYKVWNMPDVVASWKGPAIERALALHREQAFDVVYATGWPWTSFLVAAAVSRRTGLPLVVDYRDLWKASDAEWDRSSQLQRLLQPGQERRVLAQAAAVVATTGSFLKLLPQASLPAKQYAITNGFSEADFPPPAPPPENEIRIVYTGVWRPGYGPDDLYRALQLLQARAVPGLARLRVITAGFAPGPAADHGIAHLVSERGRVSHGEAIAMMAGATALYLPVSGGIYEHASIPGKLFEYLGSGRPILASAQQGSEVAGVLDRVGGALRLAPGDSEALAAALTRLCAGEEAELFAAVDPFALEQLTRAKLTQQLGAVFDAVIPQRKPAIAAVSPH